MNLEPNVAPEAAGSAEIAPTARISWRRRFYWSVRRELWEHPAIFLAPAITAAVIALGFGFATIGLAERRRATLLLEPARQRALIETPYDVAVSFIMLTAFFVWFFYCLDTLHAERRERSVLFWKSLPVSDLTTVLAKASIPFVVLPAITLVLVMFTQLVILLTSNAVLLANGVPAATASQLPLVQGWRTLPYALFAMTLWDAPLYAWLLFVSAWARHAALLWAVVPLVALNVLERVAFGTHYGWVFLQDRGIGWVSRAFAFPPHGSFLIDPLNPPTPQRLVTSPDLWLGLVVAAALLALTVRLRRDRAPL